MEQVRACHGGLLLSKMLAVSDVHIKNEGPGPANKLSGLTFMSLCPAITKGHIFYNCGIDSRNSSQTHVVKVYRAFVAVPVVSTKACCTPQINEVTNIAS